jgi:uncharacterized protein YoaH (UPF0181 family)
MLVSVFMNAFLPYVIIPNAPEDNNRIHHPSGKLEFREIIELICGGRWEIHIEKIKADGYKQNKTLIPCFTPAGVFRFRSDNELLSYSQIVSLDFDNISSVYQLKQAAIKDPHTMAAFFSPSFAGLKVFVKVNTQAGQHATAFEQVKRYYENLLGCKSDEKVKNLSRLCFVSSDRSAFYTEDAKVFEIDYSTRRPVIPKAAAFTFQFLKDFTEKKAGYYCNGNRNAFIFLFSNNCNRYGIEQELAEQFCEELRQQDAAGLSSGEVLSTVRSAYRNKHEHAKFIVPNTYNN